MKKYLNKIVMITLLAAIVFSCKKDTSLPSIPDTDYTAFLKDKTWWGEFNYTGKDAEYYSVHFNSDNTFVWSQFSGDHNGKWTVEGNELTMSIEPANTEIRAEINGDDKLINITDNTGSSTINTAHLIANSNMSLDNTVWEGKPILANGIYGYLISFVPGIKVDIQETYFEPPSLYKSYLYPGNTYKRSTGGEVVRTTFSSGGAGSSSTFFGIIVSDSVMRGSSRNANNQWKVSKNK